MSKSIYPRTGDLTALLNKRGESRQLKSSLTYIQGIYREFTEDILGDIQRINSILYCAHFQECLLGASVQCSVGSRCQKKCSVSNIGVIFGVMLDNLG